MSSSVDGNIEYFLGTSGNYLTKRKKNIMDVIAPAVVSNAIVLSEDMSGSVVVLPDSSADTDVITLPTTPLDGTNFRLLFGTDLTNDFIMAGTFEGSAVVAGSQVDLAATTSISFEKTKIKAGDYLECMYYSGKWYVNGIGTTASSFTATS